MFRSWRTTTLAMVLSTGALLPAPRDLAVLPGQRILLSGDSITKGYAFGNYTDPSPIRTIYGIANILLKENVAIPPEVRRLENIYQGLNSDGTPKTVDSLATEYQRNIRTGQIRTGDWMIYEDAGQIDITVHPAPNPIPGDLYNQYRLNIRGMVEEVDRTVGRDHFLLMTMFDYEPKCRWCKWDTPLDDGVHSANDAVRDEAASLGIRVIQMRRIMDRANEHLQKEGWGRTVGPDGIHPNIYGNTVMAFAVLSALGADIGQWKTTLLERHYLHPESGGDVKTVWGFIKDPTDAQRVEIVKDLQAIVAREMANGIIEPPASTQMHSGFIHHGRVLDHPARQPEGTARPVSYEVGKLFQLDRAHALLVASMREQGGHDFETGNDGFVFSNLADIVPEKAIAINRADANFRMKDGRPAVLAKFPVNGGFLPPQAMGSDGKVYRGGGTGFFLGAALPYRPDRADNYPDVEPFLTFQQARWNGTNLSVSDDALPEALQSTLINVGFDCLFENGSFLCPCVSREGIVIVRFDFEGDKWKPAAWGKPFRTSAREIEPSLIKTPMGFLVYTSGAADRRGRVYRSSDGLNYYLTFDHWNWTVPQSLNQGLDGSLYLTTNTGPGMLRNPLLAFPLRGATFADPMVVHDEKQIGEDKGTEVPFVDHAIASNLFLNGRWRHLLMYRVCDLRETNGQGAPPTPQTGLYMAEGRYSVITAAPFRFE